MPGKIGRGETVEASKTGLTGPSRILFPSVFSQIGPFIFLLSWKPGSSQRSKLPHGSFLWYYFCPTALTPKDLEEAGGCLPWVLMSPSDHCSSPFPKLSQPWISGCFIISPSLHHHCTHLLPSRSCSLISWWGYLLTYCHSPRTIQFNFSIYVDDPSQTPASHSENTFLHWSCPPSYYTR